MGKVTTQWITELVDGVSGPAREITQAGEQAAEAVEGIGTAARTAQDGARSLSAMDFKAAADSIRDLTAQFEDVMRPGLAFESQMKEMQSITRLSDEAMESFGQSARHTAQAYGNDAAAQLGSYSALIARFGPNVAQNSEALAIMGEDIAILSKLMQGDAVGSMDALTTAMLQFGVDLSDPVAAAGEMTRMMNVMAAAGNEGASEVGDTAEALKNSGVAAKNANLSFEETNAALQALAQGGRVGAEAGISLRNVLGKMGGMDIIPRRAQAKIRELGIDFDIVSDKTLPLATRLRELRKAQGDATLIAQIFGIENEAAANILLNSVSAQEAMTQAITGTNAAHESAAIIMESGQEQRNRFNAWVDNIKIGLHDVAGGMLPVVTGLGTIAFTIANMTSAVKGVKDMVLFMKTLNISTWLTTGAFAGFKVAGVAACRAIGVAIMNIPIVGWIAAAIAGLIALFALLWNKVEGFRKGVMGVWEVVKRFGNVLKEYVLDRVKGIVSGLGSIGEALLKLFKGDFKGGWEAAKQGVADLVGKDAARNAVQSIKEDYAVGAQKGAESWARSQAKKKEEQGGVVDAQGTGILAGLQSPAVVTPGGNPRDTSGGTTTGKNGDLGAGRAAGSGSGGGAKTINMTVNNYFNGFKGTREVAEAVARAINDRLSDGLATV